MDIDGVDAEVLYVGGPLASKDPALRLNSVRGYNRWLSDYASHAPGRLLGHGRHPDRHARAWRSRRSASRRPQPGLASGVHPAVPRPRTTTATERGTRCGRRSSRPTSRSACTSAAAGPGTPDRRASIESAPRFMTGLVMSKLTMAEAVSELIHGLVMQRYPDLKFVAVEGQIGWISFFQYYSDHLWEKHRYWTKSELKEPPSHYFRRQVFATFMEDPVGLRERHHIGIDNIMWASDYPHSETTWPNSKSLTDEWFTPYGDEDKAKILWKNCARLFDLSQRRRSGGTAGFAIRSKVLFHGPRRRRASAV